MINTSMVKLNHKIIGQGEPVILLHGLFGMLDNLQLLAKSLADQDFMVYLIDQRDHGKSPRTNEFSYDVLSEDLHDFCMEHWLHHTNVIGHSMGGKTAMQFAAHYPDIVKKMVIIDIGYKAYSGGHQEIFQALLNVDLRAISSRDEIYQILKAKLTNEGVVQFLMKNLTREKDSGLLEWKMNLPLLYKFYPEILKEVNIPYPVETQTLFIKGELSDYILESDLPDISIKFPHATFTTINGAGHWVHADQPELLTKKIVHFLKEPLQL